jgi:hypothetical protein
MNNQPIAELVDALRYRPVATTAAQMRTAADLIERQMDALQLARDWMLQADRLLDQAGYAPDCSIRHALACGLPSAQKAQENCARCHDRKTVLENNLLAKRIPCPACSPANGAAER